jgi:hypothetical protein
MRAITFMVTFYVIVFSLIFLTWESEAASVGSIVLTGNVPAATSLTIIPEPHSTALNLALSGSNVLVALITERNNTTGGYTVTVASSNGFQLVGPVNHAVAYQAFYGNTAITGPVVSVQGLQNSPVVMER